MELYKILIVGVLFAIVASLGSALFHLATDKGDSKKMVRALTVRIALSVALFLLIMLGWYLGFITPHGIDR
ncbi:MAG: twin transmembrane helix small protein [Steroidobacteraceae bacterium]